jgi:hypothetical protein
MGRLKLRLWTLLLILLMVLSSVRTSPDAAKAHLIKAVPSVDHKDRTVYLKKKLIATREELEKLKKRDKRDIRASKYEALADDMVRHSLDERNQTVRFKQLQMANEIIRDPIHTMSVLKRKLAARLKAKKALDLAKQETDPKLQVKLLEEAEKQVWLFKTGKKPIKKAVVKKPAEEEVLTADQVIGLFGEELDRFADKVAQKLILKANSILDDKMRNATLKVASGILAHPKKNIQEYVRKLDLKAEADRLLLQMRKALKHESDPKRRARLRRRMKVLEVDPVGFHDKMVEEEEKKVIDMSKEVGRNLILRAETEEDIKKAEQYIELGKLYLDYPLEYWANITEVSEKKKFLAASPPQCRPYVQGVYSLKQDALDQAFKELATPPPPLPVTGIVNFAQTGATTTTFTSKKARLANDDFEVEKRYIKVSFTGWMKRNSELNEKPPQKLASQKVKAKKTPTK